MATAPLMVSWNLLRWNLRHRDETWLVSNIHVVHNRQLESAVFDFPISSSEPLPDITQLLKEVQDNQKAVDNILESYTYTKVEEEGNVDDQGNTKNRRTREYEIFYVKGREIQKLVGKDGKPLSPDERGKEKKG